MTSTHRPQQLSFPRMSARTSRFTLGIPGHASISPDGRTVLFLRSRSGTDSLGLLWRRDVASGSDLLLLDPHKALAGNDEALPASEAAMRERLRVSGSGVTSYSVDADVTTAAVALSGRVFCVCVATGDVTEVPSPEAAVDPRISPDGRHVAMHSQGGLYVSHHDPCSSEQSRSGEPRLLVGEDDASVTWGLADFVHAEELGRTRGFWWAPDSSGLLVTRVDESDVQTWHIGDPARPDREPTQVRYPAAGTQNARTRLWWVPLEGPRTELMWDPAGSDHADLGYLAGVRWQPGRPALVWTLSRDQRRLRIHAWRPESDLELLREITDSAWVDLVPGAPAWLGERLVTVEPGPGPTGSGDQEYRLLADGAPLLLGGQVRSVSVIDDALTATVMTFPGRRRTALVSADGEVAWLGDDSQALSTGIHRAGVTVLREDSADVPQARVHLVSREGAQTIRSLALEPPLTPRAQRLVRDHDDDPRVALLLPQGADASGNRRAGQLPVLLDPYGGPHGQRVLDSSRAYLEAQWWADQGFVVLVADGPGTPGSPRWERAMAGSFARPALAAQMRALDMLAEQHPGLGDLDRVGIRGWSFGGYLAALAVLERPDRVHAAVSGAPVTDWRLYDTAYTERYLGMPQEHPSRYDEESLIERAPKLRRPLMLIHGTSDDNVVVAHTLRLSGALLAAGRRHQVLPLSGVTHMTPQEEVAENLLLLQRDFLLESLRMQDPRSD